MTAVEMTVPVSPDGQSGTPTEGGPSERRRVPRVHDFRMPKTLDRNGIRALQVHYEVLTHRAGGQLSTRLRAPITLSLGDFQQQSWGEYTGSLSEPTCLFSVTMPPLQGRAVLHLPLPLAMLIVDLRMGGNGKRTFTPERGLTEIEQRMVSDVAEAVLSQLPSVFGSVVSFQIGTPVQVASVQFLPPVRHTDMVLIVPINLEINEESTSSFDLCFPFSVVQPMVEALAIQRQDEEIPGGADAVAVAHCLLDTAVDIRVRFPSTSLTPADFLNLSVGDVVGLPYDQGDPLALMVSDQHHLDVLPTTSGKRLACVVVDQVEKH